MLAESFPASPTLMARARAWRDRRVADPRFRAWATRFLLTRPIARRRTRALFDLCAGFVYAQVLVACVELGLFDMLTDGARTARQLAPPLGLTLERAERLLGAAVSLRLLARRGDAFGLGPLGAATIGNPAVTEMVRHHAMLYADLADPVALLRARPGGTRLAEFWRYGTDAAPAGLGSVDVAAYSGLMAASLPLVAAEVLDSYDVRRHHCLMDVGGGEGAFLAAVADRAPLLGLMLFDLPAVTARARARFAESGLVARTVGGDVHAGVLPVGADLISLVRVIHDHDDPAALAILRAVHGALPPGGTLLLAEPMADTSGAEPVGGAYFAMYLLALGSGRARSPAALTSMLKQAGFASVRRRRTANPAVTSLIVARA